MACRVRGPVLSVAQAWDEVTAPTVNFYNPPLNLLPDGS